MGPGRRNFLRAFGITAAFVAHGSVARATLPRFLPHPPSARPRRPGRLSPSETFLFFNSFEAETVGAAVDVIIPADASGPGGVEAGVVHYIDRQLAGSFGGGQDLYRAGPWRPGLAGQGYQLPLSPAEAYRVAIDDLNAMSRACYGDIFAALGPDKREEILTGMEAGDVELTSVPGRVFMDLLLANVMEGYFCDPGYGGNRDMAAWSMIGYPGVGGAYGDAFVRFRGRQFPVTPVSLAALQ